MILFGFVLLVSSTAASADAVVSDLTEETAYQLIEANQNVVDQGYETEQWVRNDTKWYTVVRCYTPLFMTLGAKAECLVCSIDGVGKQIFNNPSYVYNGGESPTNSVAITASTAFFTHAPEGWKITSFRPFGMNYIAPNRHPYLSADLENMKKTAPLECLEMEGMMQSVGRG